MAAARSAAASLSRVRPRPSRPPRAGQRCARRPGWRRASWIGRANGLLAVALVATAVVAWVALGRAEPGSLAARVREDTAEALLTLRQERVGGEFGAWACQMAIR